MGTVSDTSSSSRVPLASEKAFNSAKTGSTADAMREHKMLPMNITAEPCIRGSVVRLALRLALRFVLRLALGSDRNSAKRSAI